MDYLQKVKQSIEGFRGTYAGEVSCLTEAGDPASWIIDEAKNMPGTLIAMTTQWALGGKAVDAGKRHRQSGETCGRACLGNTVYVLTLALT